MVRSATYGSAAPRCGGGRTVTPLIVVLAVTQTVGYGVLTYAFAVLLTPMAVELHTSTALVTGAYTLSVVTAAAAAIPAGRWLDRHGGRGLMAWGSTLGVAAVIAWSQVHQVWQLYLVFVFIGVAAAASLYEAAFPVVIAVTDTAGRNRALLAVTIVAGFASSIFLPLTGWLLASHGWRTTLLMLAALLAATAIPGHVLVVPPQHRHRAVMRDRGGSSVREALRGSQFWLLAGAFVSQGAATSAVGVLLVVYLRHAGQPVTVAATIAGLLGVLSVTGRLLTTRLARRYSMATVASVVFAVQAVGAFALQFLAGSLASAAICVAAFGVGFGVATIARPAIVAGAYGTHQYATIAATMSLPITLAKAAAPIAAAAAGMGQFMVWTGCACVLASGLLLWAAVQQGRDPASGSEGSAKQAPTGPGASGLPAGLRGTAHG